MSVIASRRSLRSNPVRWIATHLMVLAMTACAPQQQPYLAAAAEPVFAKEIFYASDAAAVPYRAWLPKKPKAIVVALHGMNDYSRAFETVGPYLRERGIGVYAYDQRGFGAATQAGMWGNNENLKRDLKEFVATAAARHPNLPIYVLGESMGGAVAIAAVAEADFPPLRGLILVAPALWGGDSMNPVFRGMLWAMAHTVPDYKMTGSDLKILASDNIPMLIALGKDPLILKATRTDAIYGLVGMMDEAYEAIPRLNVPVLMLYGGKDQVIPPDPIEIALARFRQPITFVFYPDGYHMLLRDLRGDIPLDDVASWIMKPGEALPSGMGKTVP